MFDCILQILPPGFFDFQSRGEDQADGEICRVHFEHTSTPTMLAFNQHQSATHSYDIQCILLQRPIMSERASMTGTKTVTQTQRCAICDQTFERTETIDISASASNHESLCQYCAEGLFDIELSSEEVSATQGHHSQQVSASDTSKKDASAVSWNLPRHRSYTNSESSLMQMHYLSLSLLWAIHRTNVRLLEKILDNIDIQMISVLWLTLSTAVIIVLSFS